MRENPRPPDGKAVAGTYYLAPQFYQEPRVALTAARSGNWIVEIVKRNELPPFIVLWKRWIVERVIAWLNRYRRLAKDWENLNRKALTFLHLASIRLMLRKLCNPQ